ncbi:thioredoxin-like protein [Mrakia frigida]|uniref:DsbA family oxidoreductase n=1 Tax=Mrakia frigida TaxID=29902 RepID=UPI003FCBF462
MATSVAPRTIKLDITSDAICPFCFIGLRKIQAAIASSKAKDPSLNFSLEFHPYLLDPTLSTTPTNKRGRYIEKFGGAERVESMEKMMIARGKEVGINFSYGGNLSQTHNAHRLLTLAYQKGGEKMQLDLVELLFKGYFEDEKDVGDFEFLSESAVGAGVFDSAEEVKSFLATKLLIPEIGKAYARAQALGIQGVPFTVVDGKYGISGAQESETFAEIFDKIAKGESPA